MALERGGGTAFPTLQKKIRRMFQTADKYIVKLVGQNFL